MYMSAEFSGVYMWTSIQGKGHNKETYYAEIG